MAFFSNRIRESRRKSWVDSRLSTFLWCLEPAWVGARCKTSRGKTDLLAATDGPHPLAGTPPSVSHLVALHHPRLEQAMAAGKGNLCLSEGLTRRVVQRSKENYTWHRTVRLTR